MQNVIVLYCITGHNSLSTTQSNQSLAYHQQQFTQSYINYILYINKLSTLLVYCFFNTMSSRRKVNRSVKSSPNSSPRSDHHTISEKIEHMIDELVDNSGDVDEVNQQELQSIRNGMFM